MDIVLSFCALILFLPLFLIIALLIKLDDPRGRILYSQIRIGKKGRPFRMYKFRSMCTNAEAQLAEIKRENEISGPMFKMKEDPRITKIGKYLRKFSLDEFPQFINVIKGDMSLVGPRPPLEWEVLEYKGDDFKRLEIKPGITGLWQVSLRNSTSFRGMLELDLLYINNLSLKKDLLILVKTVKVVLFPNNAY
ncbi:sugar transferase [uncultured Vagococcus sp.]|uniref:sugar transferase n=1 Tax=uncultured Vagococcus sp. TaxID=189676 RepID=UPI0028D8AE78|nr:sugar transferase [uncultured Vagococcus sp.]